jgi:hypothetical protein
MWFSYGKEMDDGWRGQQMTDKWTEGKRVSNGKEYVRLKKGRRT